MSRQSILVVEDEPAIADTIVYALASDGFEPHWCATGGAAVEAAQTGRFALAVLDVGLPDINGFELFKQLQQIGTGLPAIFLTARSNEIDKVVGLELGADDYIAKPFSPRELVARVRSVLRRSARAGVPAPAAARCCGVYSALRQTWPRRRRRAASTSTTSARRFGCTVARWICHAPSIDC